jgi:hypothetical protein
MERYPWLDGSLPPATADEVIDALQAVRWRGAWGAEALDVEHTCSYVNSIDTTIDHDYVMCYLVEVCDRDVLATHHYLHGPDLVPSETGETWVNYLAVRVGPGDKRVACWWSPRPRRYYPDDPPARQRFFARVPGTTSVIRRWFVDFDDGEIEAATECASRRRSSE